MESNNDNIIDETVDFLTDVRGLTTDLTTSEGQLNAKPGLEVESLFSKLHNSGLFTAESKEVLPQKGQQ